MGAGVPRLGPDFDGVPSAVMLDSVEILASDTISGVCPLCLTLGEKLARAFRDNVPGSELAKQAKERMVALMDAQDERDGA